MSYADRHASEMHAVSDVSTGHVGRGGKASAAWGMPRAIGPTRPSSNVPVKCHLVGLKRAAPAVEKPTHGAGRIAAEELYALAADLREGL